MYDYQYFKEMYNTKKWSPSEAESFHNFLNIFTEVSMALQTISGVTEKTDRNGDQFKVLEFASGVKASTWDKKFFDFCTPGKSVDVEMTSQTKQGRTYHNIVDMVPTENVDRSSGAGSAGVIVTELTRQLMYNYGNSRNAAIAFAAVVAGEGAKAEDVFTLVNTYTEKFFVKSNETLAIAVRDAESLMEFDDDPPKPAEKKDDDIPF